MIKLSRDLLVSLVAPALVLVLVAAQVAYGLRGFDNPLGGLAAVFEVPGMLVGWGSLGFLLPLLGFLVLDWWGIGAPGIALKCLGAAALALALGGVFGVIGGIPLGGHLGGSLETLLVDTLGVVPSLLLLGIMAVPGAVLTFAGFREVARALATEKSGSTTARASSASTKRASTTSSTSGSTKAASKRKRDDDSPSAWRTISAKVRGLFKSTRRVSDLTDLVRTDGMEARKSENQAQRYPTRRYDDLGHEMPMDLSGQRDVGGIRFADDEGGSADVVVATSEHIANAPDAPASEPQGDDKAAAEITPTLATSASTSTPALPTIPQLFADAQAVMESGTSNESGVLETRPVREDAGDRALGRVVGLRSEQREEVLPDGVRWADAPPLPSKPKYAESEAADPEDLLAAQAEAVAARFDKVEANPAPMRKSDVEEDEALTVADLPPSARDLGEQLSRRSSPADSESPSTSTASVRDSVLQALGEAQNDSNKRYQEKLAASGIFDFMDEDDPSLRVDPEPTREATKLTPKKPLKKSTRKPAAKKAAPKKAASRKATSKKTASKKAASKKAAPKKAEAEKPAPKKGPTATDAGASKDDAGAKKGSSRSGGSSRGPRGRGSSTQPVSKPAAARVKPPRSTDTATENPADGSRPWRGGAWHARGSLRTQARDAVDEVQAGQLRLARQNPLFKRASDLVVERGAGSPVLLTRRLGLSTSQARSLISEMVALGVLAEAGARGGHAARFSPATWASLDRA